jgi:glycerol kinase
VSILVVDVGSSSVRASVVSEDGTVGQACTERVAATSPMPSFVEYDAKQIADAVLRVSRAALDEAGGARSGVEGIGVANQRATTVLWDRATGEPLGPAISWQDLRTVGTCLMLRAEGLPAVPNESSTKLSFLLDMADPDRSKDVCFGTVDSWVAWTLSEGALHVTDATNAGVSGLRSVDAAGWDDRVLDALRIPREVLPEVVDSSGLIGDATALGESLPICGIVGDQQASLVGQGCTAAGMAKITFGTGGFLDMCVGPDRPRFSRRGSAGTFPIAAWRRRNKLTWGIEGVILSAGSCVDWLRDDLGLVATSSETADLAGSVKDSGDVWFVPALFGIGTPIWDFGARGAFVGITRGTGRAEMARALLEGVAHRGCDLMESAESDTGNRIEQIRIDGGMSGNEVFVEVLANFSGRPVEVAPMTECTTLGAAYLAGMALGVWKDEDEVSELWRPRRVVEPRLGSTAADSLRQRWQTARSRALQTVPELSAVQFWDN